MAKVLLGVLFLLTNGRSINFFSLKQDVEIGSESAKEAEQSLSLVRDLNIAGYFLTIGQRLSQNSTLPALRYHFRIVNSREINSLGFPGGGVYIYRGLLQIASNDDELAAILAHEIAHIASRHGTIIPPTDRPGPDRHRSRSAGHRSLEGTTRKARDFSRHRRSVSEIQQGSGARGKSSCGAPYGRCPIRSGRVPDLAGKSQRDADRRSCACAQFCIQSPAIGNHCPRNCGRDRAAQHEFPACASLRGISRIPDKP